VAVRRVEDDGVHVLADERIHTLHRIARDAYAGGYAQTALAVLAGVGVVLYFGNILIGNQSDEFPLVVHDGQLLDLVVEQHVGRMGQLRRMGGDEVLRGHHLRNQAVHVALETQVAVGDDADQPPLGVDHGDAADLVLLHQRERVAHGVLLGDGDRVVNHAVLGAFHTAHVRGLLGDGHVLVDDPDAPFASQRDRQRRFGDRIHCGRDDRNVEFDISRKAAGDVYFARQHLRIGGYEQDVIERESGRLYPLIDKRHNDWGFCCAQK